MRKGTARVCIVITVIAFSAAARWTQDELRTKVRRDAYNAGVDLSNVWTRVDIYRKLLMTGGSLTSTQEQHRFFLSVTNSSPFLTSIDQSIATPETSLYPATFSVGYNPYDTEKDARGEEAIRAFTNELFSTGSAVTNGTETETKSNEAVPADTPATSLTL